MLGTFSGAYPTIPGHEVVGKVRSIGTFAGYGDEDGGGGGGGGGGDIGVARGPGCIVVGADVCCCYCCVFWCYLLSL